MRRVLVVGSPGAGKTIFSRALAEREKLPLIHLDRLYWQDGWQPVSREVFDARLAEAMEGPAWILDGNYSRTLPWRLERCDTVVFLDYPRFVCLLGVLRRVIVHYGRTRPDMGGNCPERLDWEFLKYVWGFPKTHRPALLAKLEERGRDKRVVVLRSRRQAARFLRALGAPEQGAGSGGL